MPSCAHVRSIERFDLPDDVPGCEECLAEGMSWVHLRMCQTCGHIGCCDHSPGRHATAHFEATGHPIVRSAERGEEWSWCYVDQLLLHLSRP
jgi:CPA1 family monovalent cation:H+ antiporter